MSSHRASGASGFREGRKCGVSRDLGRCGRCRRARLGREVRACTCVCMCVCGSVCAHAVPAFTWECSTCGQALPSLGPGGKSVLGR